MSIPARHERGTGQRRPTGGGLRPPGRRRVGLGGPPRGLRNLGLAARTARDREIMRQIGRMLDAVPATRALLTRLLELTRPQTVTAAERAEAVGIADTVTRILAALSAADGDVRPPMTVRSGWEN